jgi:hypothetical protein
MCLATTYVLNDIPIIAGSNILIPAIIGKSICILTISLNTKTNARFSTDILNYTNDIQFSVVSFTGKYIYPPNTDVILTADSNDTLNGCITFCYL